MSERWEIDRSLLDRLAEVSRLDLSDEELEKFKDQLRVILEAFREIDKVDTNGIEPSFHPSETKNVLRDDKAKPWEWDPLANSKHQEGKYFKGPRIA